VCRAYLHGIDLFNYGYYWEAHEAWEGVWRSYERSETTALFLQGLIKLAAAGVKIREGMPRGVANLAGGAADHFDEVLLRPDGREIFCGLNVAHLAAVARSVEMESTRTPADAETGPRVVIDIVLRPEDAAT
jgi:hypothetical protein